GRGGAGAWEEWMGKARGRHWQFTRAGPVGSAGKERAVHFGDAVPVRLDGGRLPAVRAAVQDRVVMEPYPSGVHLLCHGPQRTLCDQGLGRGGGRLRGGFARLLGVRVRHVRGVPDARQPQAGACPRELQAAGVLGDGASAATPPGTAGAEDHGDAVGPARPRLERPRGGPGGGAHRVLPLPGGVPARAQGPRPALRPCLPSGLRGRLVPGQAVPPQDLPALQAQPGSRRGGAVRPGAGGAARRRCPAGAVGRRPREGGAGCRRRQRGRGHWRTGV
ncbi:unnamed protein product, partial [Prorocentrum cordatum]